MFHFRRRKWKTSNPEEILKFSGLSGLPDSGRQNTLDLDSTHQIRKYSISFIQISSKIFSGL